MNRLAHKAKNYSLRKSRVRSTVAGTSERPRLTVYVSNRNITAQIIDDSKHITLVYLTTAKIKSAGQTMTEKANWLGLEIAKQAKSAKVKKVVFDRGGRLYHGRVAELAEAARKGGLEF